MVMVCMEGADPEGRARQENLSTRLSLIDKTYFSFSSENRSSKERN